MNSIKKKKKLNKVLLKNEPDEIKIIRNWFLITPTISINTSFFIKKRNYIRKNL
jgi:hypothetical protein